jgi:hypothetical protein
MGQQIETQVAAYDGNLGCTSSQESSAAFVGDILLPEFAVTSWVFTQSIIRMHSDP